MMYRKFIATILTVSVGITGFASSEARASDNDLLKVLGGVAALAVIGAAIADAKNDDRHGADRQGYRKHHGKRHHSRDRWADHHDDRFARPLPERARRKMLPAGCRVQARNQHGVFPAYGRGCLERSFRHAGQLPAQCATRARTRQHGPKNIVYSGRCLAQYGYEISRR